MHTDQFSTLFRRYIDDAATPEETDRLMQLIAQSTHDRLLRKALEEAWLNSAPVDDQLTFQQPEEAWNALLNRLQEAGPQSSPFPVKGRMRSLSPVMWVAAAVLLLIVASGAYFMLRSGDAGADGRGLSASKAGLTAGDVAPGTEKAILKLDDGRTIALDSAANGLISEQAGIRVVKKDGIVSYDFGQVAAQKEEGEGPAMYNTIITPRKSVYRVVLSDGTEVWLNAASSIRFPVHFAGNEREVEITGEVYFDVNANSSHRPFTIKCRNQEVSVLGTSFNINAYSDEGAVKTTLLTGSVRVFSFPDKTTVLKPGQQSIVFDNRSMPMRTVSVPEDDVIAWKKGLFLFEDSDLSGILRQLARWYDVRIEGDIPEKHYTGIIPRESNLSEVLKMLSITGNEVTFTLDDNTIYVKSKSK